MPKAKTAKRYKVYSRFEKRPTEPAPAGSREMPVYEIEIDERGHKNLVKTGVKNIYDKIQAPLESTKIENILRRAAGGDATALAQTNGQFVDCTDMPTSFSAMQNTISRMRQEFEKLPIEIRREYNNSAEQYIADYGSKNWMEKLGLKTEEPKKTEKEVTVSESEQ